MGSAPRPFQSQHWSTSSIFAKSARIGWRKSANLLIRQLQLSTTKILSVTQTFPWSTFVQLQRAALPIARDCLKAGKHVLLEKPIAMEFWEADELIKIARDNGLKFTIGYSQRFNPKIAYAKKKIADGTLAMWSTSWSAGTFPAAWARRSRPGLTFRPPRWNRPTISISSSGCWSRPSRSASTRRAPMAICRHQWLLRYHVDDSDHGQWRTGRHRRRLESAARAIRIFAPPGSRSREPKARCSSTTHTGTIGSTP